LARAHGLPEVSVISGQTAGFRHRARLAIRGRLGSPKLGLFELGTHRVVHIPNCSVQHALINRVAAVVRRALVDVQVTSYSDRAHLGLARYLQVVVERSSQTAQVVIVANSATPEPLAACLDLIRERLGSDLHSLWFNPNRERSNTILGPDFQHWCGPASVVERFGGAAVHYPPGAFGQNNLEIAHSIIEHVRGQIPDGARVVEFYAGVGAIGFSVGRHRGGLSAPCRFPHCKRRLTTRGTLDAAHTTTLPTPHGCLPAFERTSLNGKVLNSGRAWSTRGWHIFETTNNKTVWLRREQGLRYLLSCWTIQHNYWEVLLSLFQLWLLVRLLQ